MQKVNFKFIQGVDYELIRNLPINETNNLLKFDDSCEKISWSKVCWKTQWNEYNMYSASFVSSKHIGKRCRVKKYTYSLVQVNARCFTNQNIKSTTRSRLKIERVCNINSFWSFTHWFISEKSWFALILHKQWFSSVKILFTSRIRNKVFGLWAYNTSLYSQFFS